MGARVHRVGARLVFAHLVHAGGNEDGEEMSGRG
jgi:hypothetical protein